MAVIVARLENRRQLRYSFVQQQAAKEASRRRCADDSIISLSGFDVLNTVCMYHIFVLKAPRTTVDCDALLTLKRLKIALRWRSRQRRGADSHNAVGG